MAWQRFTLPDADVGDAGELPPYFAGYSAAILADCSAHFSPDVCEGLGVTGQGFRWVNDASTARNISALAFKQRVPPGKRIAIRADAPSDPLIADFLDLLNTPGQGLIDLDHPDTVNGCAYLVARGYLTPAEAAAVRA